MFCRESRVSSTAGPAHHSLPAQINIGTTVSLRGATPEGLNLLAAILAEGTRMQCNLGDNTSAEVF